MPVSKKGHTKKNNSFGLRKKDKAKKELREWQERNMANRHYEPFSTAEILAPAFAIQALSHRVKRAKREDDK